MTTHSIDLYLAPGACSLAPHILLHEVGVPFSTTIVSVKSGLPADFKTVNPKMRVPVLIMDGHTITEVPAIMLATSQLAPEKDLMGETDLEKVRVLEWLNWLSGTLHGQAFGGLLRPGRYTDDEKLYEAIREKGLRNLKEGFGQIEAWLGEGQGAKYTVGGRFMGVDALLYVFYRWGVGRGFDMQKEYPRFAELAREVEGREATVMALASEHLAAL
ncbi:hypothetical protein EDD37DRAFT_649685 [Exophiala viscosa]|uniref:uncharacterized protein n=1 Tax=Exophiala viscosa TaxID=2486360 RepID=UPI002191116B|nr:hypothetical protein EDD37DRAFT_649685 [Exophiala viscosa]